MYSTYRALQRATTILFPEGGWRQPRAFVRLWVQGLLNCRLVSKAYNETGPGNLHQDADRESEFLGILAWPLVDARWSTAQRIHEFLRHYREAARMGDLLLLQMEEVRSTLALDTICETLEISLERRTWFSREGQLTLSLFYAKQRVYSLTFLISQLHGQRVAYIGGIQGAKQSDDSDTHKILTKAAHGMRPRDLTIALFQALCEAMHVRQILAVQDKYRHHQHHYLGKDGNPNVFADYDAIWTENGGILQPNGMYYLAPGVRTKDLGDVPSKKRSMYRKREALLEHCRQSLKTFVQTRRLIQPTVHSNPGPAPLSTQRPGGWRPSRRISTWLSRIRPAFWGSWLWSFPVLFM